MGGPPGPGPIPVEVTPVRPSGPSAGPSVDDGTDGGPQVDSSNAQSSGPLVPTPGPTPGPSAGPPNPLATMNKERVLLILAICAALILAYMLWMKKRKKGRR
jgi:hypothetical protein